MTCEWVVGEGGGSTGEQDVLATYVDDMNFYNAALG